MSTELYSNRSPPLAALSLPSRHRQAGPERHSSATRVRVSPNPLRPRGPKPPARICRCPAQPGSARLPVKHVLEFGWGRGDREAGFRDGTGAVTLREPGPDEKQEHGGSQHPSHAHGGRTLRAAGHERRPSGAGERHGVREVQGERQLRGGLESPLRSGCRGTGKRGRSGTRSCARRSAPGPRPAAARVRSVCSRSWLRLGT